MSRQVASARMQPCQGKHDKCPTVAMCEAASLCGEADCREADCRLQIAEFSVRARGCYWCRECLIVSAGLVQDTKAPIIGACLTVMPGGRP